MMINLSFWKTSAVLLFLLLAGLNGIWAAEQNKNTADAVWNIQESQGKCSVTLTIPKGQKMSADMTYPAFSPEVEVSNISFPETRSLSDEFLGITLQIYSGPGKYTWTVPAEQLRFPLTVTLNHQSCSDSGLCSVPMQKEISFGSLQEIVKGKTISTGQDLPEQISKPVPMGTGPDEEPAPYILLPEFKIIRSVAGYQPPDDFLVFLRTSSADSGAAGSNPFAGSKFWWMLILALMGGAALNLTPCVLPLIPVNLAMIGALGNQEENSLEKRILRGLFYGSGIAVCYGLLGIICVITGSTFGAVDASPVFNWAVALLFLLLALSMFDLFTLDFSRYGNKFKMPSSTKYGGIFFMGAVAALLAGACVAPVLVAVLIQAATMFRQGDYTGFLLPFFLGLGMALPWPFLAAGMSLFPRPGKWMVKVKYALGILILCLAGYYAYTGTSIMLQKELPQSTLQNDLEQLNQALLESQSSGKPVLVDFWATWCKSCTAMEHRTFADPAVKRELEENYHFVRIQAEDPQDKTTENLRKDFQVFGLPTNVIIRAE